MKKYSSLFFIFLCLFIIASCRWSKLEKNLSPNEKEFLSKVRYIITKKEKEIFLNLPPSERKAFIKEFWEKRDPDPFTEENEFKKEYFRRIEEANKLFKEGGTPGWLQDRGRIYILLGPPEHREKYPTGYTFYGRPMEIWYYGPYPIVFIDYSYVGDYELYPLSARYVAELLKAQLNLKPKVKLNKVILDFKLNIDRAGENRIYVQIKIPYQNIWFVEKDSNLETTLKLLLIIYSNSGKKIWAFEKKYFISLSPKEIKKALGKSYLIGVKTDSLSSGTYKMKIFLMNQTDEKKVEKTVKFKL